LWKKINEKWKSEIKFYRPHAPEICVVKGGCIYGQHYHLVTSRKSVYTYGILVASRNLKEYYEHEPYVDDYGELLADNVFRKVVSINEDVPFDKEYVISLGRSTKNPKVTFHFVQSTSPNVKYGDEQSVQIIGTLSMDITDGSNLSKKEAYRPCTEVTFKFGTEIYVTTKCMKNNEKNSITLKFHGF